MKDIWVLFRKEVAGLSRGLTFWLAAGGMLLLSGWLLILNLWAFSQQAIIFGGPGMDFNEGMVTPMLGEASFFALLIAPFLTIGLFAQEKREGTLEFLLSQPVNPRAIVWGKYISATLALFLIQSLPLMGLAWLSRIGGVDLGHLGAGLFGLLLLSGALVALGLFLSSLTDSPLTALLVTWPLFILLWTAGFAQAGVGAFSEEGWARIVGLFDLQGRMSGFTQGVINFEDMVFLIAFALFWVFMTRRSLEAQGWK